MKEKTNKGRAKQRAFLFNVLCMLLFLFGFFLCSTVDARHLKLYGDKRPATGVTWVTYTNDFIPSLAIPSSAGDEGNVMYHEIEIETGIMDRWSQSIYFDVDSQSGSPDPEDNDLKLTLIKTEFNIAVFESKWFYFRLNNEWAFSTGKYTDPLAQELYSNSIELRPIFTKSVDNFTFILGPGFFYRYEEAPIGLAYFYANAVQYNISDKITTGIEFHGDMGDMRVSSSQAHYVVPNIDIQLSKMLVVSVGIGFGLNNQSEEYTFRNALQVGYQW